MNKTVKIDYTNWKGERKMRKILPEKVWFGHTQYHTEDQWLLDALDMEKQEMRTFAMKDVHSWK